MISDAIIIESLASKNPGVPSVPAVSWSVLRAFCPFARHVPQLEESEFGDETEKNLTVCENAERAPKNVSAKHMSIFFKVPPICTYPSVMLGICLTIPLDAKKARAHPPHPQNCTRPPIFLRSRIGVPIGNLIVLVSIIPTYSIYL